MDDDGPDGTALSDPGWALLRVHDTPPTLFQVLGERGSGTNVVRKAIGTSLQVARTEALGWKHGFPAMLAIPRQVLVVCVFRDAFDWARSLYARPWHGHPDLQALDFSAFLRAEWHGVVDRAGDFEMIHPELRAEGAELQYDRHPITGARFDTIFALRRAKAEALLGMALRDCNVAFVRLEAFRAAPEAFLGALADTYGLGWTARGYRAPTRRMGTRFSPSVPGRAAPPATLSPEDRAFVMQALDPALERRLGYVYGPQTG